MKLINEKGAFPANFLFAFISLTVTLDTIAHKYVSVQRANADKVT